MGFLRRFLSEIESRGGTADDAPRLPKLNFPAHRLIRCADLTIRDGFYWALGQSIVFRAYFRQRTGRGAIRWRPALRLADVHALGGRIPKTPWRFPGQDPLLTLNGRQMPRLRAKMGKKACFFCGLVVIFLLFDDRYLESGPQRSAFFL